MKTKALISFTVTAKLICVFVFAYADCLFSYDMVQTAAVVLGSGSQADQTSHSSGYSATSPVDETTI